MKIDLLSDIHLDDIDGLQNMNDFVNRLLPKEPNKLLVIAGDFGYDNDQTMDFLTHLKVHYETILFVYGNNDLKIKLNYYPFDHVKDRIIAFEERIEKIKGVYRLTPTPIDIRGKVFIGSELFADKRSSIKRGHRLTDIDAKWKEKGFNKRHVGWIQDIEEHAKREKEKLINHITHADVIVTHGQPDFLRRDNDHALGFFSFIADEFKGKISGKTWVYGHKHCRSFERMFDCSFHNASYQGEHKDKRIVQTTI